MKSNTKRTQENDSFQLPAREHRGPAQMLALYLSMAGISWFLGQYNNQR